MNESLLCYVLGGLAACTVISDLIYCRIRHIQWWDGQPIDSIDRLAKKARKQ